MAPMTKDELRALIANGENSMLEFKKDDLHPSSLAEEIVAFANMSGGKILLGVDDNGEIVGVRRPNIEEWVMVGTTKRIASTDELARLF